LAIRSRYKVRAINCWGHETSTRVSHTSSSQEIRYKTSLLIKDRAAIIAWISSCPENPTCSRSMRNDSQRTFSLRRRSKHCTGIEPPAVNHLSIRIIGNTTCQLMETLYSSQLSSTKCPEWTNRLWW
jgi:hypothetical protein